MVGELADVASWHADSDTPPALFVHTVAALEVRKLRRFGFKLSSSVSGNRLVHFTLRVAETGELCASMDVNPATGEMTAQHTCV